MAIQMRRGNQADFNPAKMLPGEWAISLDAEKIYMCYAPGRVVEVGSASSLLPYIQEAEAWAVGEKGGEPVESTDPTYHNNSKYYSDQAEDSATNAATSESNASNSAGDASDSAEDSEAWAVGTRNGQAVPSTDPAYNNNAKHWAESAAAIVGIGIATTQTAGIVKPDGTSITVDNDGTIHSTGGVYSVSGKKMIFYMSPHE